MGTTRRQDFVARYKDDGISCELSSPFCNIGTTILVRQSMSPEDREIGRRFASLWAVLLVPKLQEILPDRDAKCTFIVPSLGVRAQILSICDCRNGVGKRVFKLAPFGHDPLFDITAPNFCELSASDVVLRHFLSSKPSGSGSRGKCVIAAPSPPRPFAAWRVEAFFFLRRSSLVVCSNCDLSVQMPDPVNRTPTNTARTELHSISHSITRTRVAQDQGMRILVSLKNNCHPRVMSHSVPHLTLITSTSSLSPFFIHLFYLSDGLTHTNKHYESQPM